MNNVKQLVRNYQDIAIPADLESIITNTIVRKEKDMKRRTVIKISLASVAAMAIVFVTTVNLSPVAADAMLRIPVISSLVRLVTFRELVYQDDRHFAQIKVPHVEGLEDNDLELALNKKYLDENTELYRKFLRDIGKEELSPQIMALYTNYTVKTNVDGLFVVERIKTEIAASGKETICYDNIDLKNQLIITLPSLFVDDSYIDVITAEIKDQMRQQIDVGEGMMYFIQEDGAVGGFDKIRSDQTFYIRSDAKLVIVFDEYEVAPGSMGIVEFVIPTEKIRDILVSSYYVSAGLLDPALDSLVYDNAQYGFRFTLPASWQGYSIVTSTWEGLATVSTQGEQAVEMGPLLSIRHPQWTDNRPRQDIPIMVFTQDQWNQLTQDKFNIGAAPIGPRKLGQNTDYVFALPARYNYAFPEGFEEVDEIIESDPLQA